MLTNFTRVSKGSKIDNLSFSHEGHKEHRNHLEAEKYRWSVTLPYPAMGGEGPVPDLQSKIS
ncbi:hypothetical protein CH333_09915 [candidate division WOR-3 bacterium JGI_Cruoil_03_44_89]|uniref:Uncharacterized protein n=1 Tax=candidate division WOR-3 bacterium JGI_Cruoil_03_44_89 TaxID=1973748 RepID=A0A235BN57_UNCW3|nr:MAG: hypothetical protein CH333_09915 [candidate division WOR-3 bacterium JGI_Cruoil_03_44_89]